MPVKSVLKPALKKQTSQISGNKKTTKWTKEELEKFKFNSQHRGWQGPVTESTIPSRLMTLKMKKESAQPKVTTLKHNKKNDPTPSEDNESEDEVASVCEDPETELADIVNPFTSPGDLSKCSHWAVPTLEVCNKRGKDFTFARPSVDRESDSFISSNQQLKMMEARLQKKEEEVTILRQHLMKSQRENHKLAQKVQKCSGKDYSDLMRENQELKSHLDRMKRDNIKLQGQLMRENNRSLQRMQEQREMEERMVRRK